VTASDEQQANERNRRFRRQIETKSVRRQRANKHPRHSSWFGVGMFGLIGWSVSIPTLLGIALGIWLDAHYSVGHISWTLSLLIMGMMLGCLNAAHWINRERKLEHLDIPPIQEDGSE
jgi:ATP synthase protein I